MTVFLMLGAVWGNSAKADDIYKELDNNTILGSQYYLIGDGSGNFLKAGEDGDSFTILASQTIKLDANSSENEIRSAQWAIEAYKPEGSATISGYRLKSRKTGHYLKFINEDKLPEVSDNPSISIFTWFGSDKKYTTDGKELYINEAEQRGIVISNNKVTIATSNLTSLQVCTLEEAGMSSEELNQQMGNGFILAAKKGNTQIKVEENGLLNKKLVAFSFYVKTAFTNGNNSVKKIIGDDPSGITTPSAKRMYLAVSGYEDLMKYVETDNSYTIDIKEEVKDATNNKTLWEANDVVAAFEKTTFVAVDKIRNYNPIEQTMGLGYQYTTFTGEDLLNAGGKQVPIENAQFDFINNSSLGSTSSSDYLIITNKYAFFPDESGYMNKQIKERDEYTGVRPYVKENEDVENKKYYLTSAPAKGNYVWTQIGFSSSGGTVNYYDHFKGKKYSVTIADKEIEDKQGTLYPNDLYPDLSVYGWLINPFTNGYKDLDDNTYHSNLTFEEPTKILANKPEGQWIFEYDDQQDIFLMYNRESNKFFSLGKTIYKVNNSNNLYYIPGGIEGYIAGFSQTFKIDTLRLATTTLEGFDGYAHCKKTGDAFDPVILKNTAYKLGIQNGTFDNSIVYVQRSSTHNNTLVVDVKTDEGLSFYLVPCDTVPYGITTFEEGGYYDANKKQPIDNLKRIKYALQERTSKRYVIYDPANRRFVLSDDYDNVDKALEESAKFFFKEKEEGQYILLYCEEYYDKEKKLWYDRTIDKMYANIGDACLHKINMYKKDIADKFGFYSSVSPMFADIMKKHKGDNDTTLVKINLYSVQNRSGNQKYMLAAGQNNFLAEGIPDTRSDIIINSKAIGGLAYDSIKFSITVDTAYVRRTYMTDENGKRYLSSVMPLYYLGMSSLDPKENVDRDTIGPLHPWDKDEFGHLIECQHYLRYTSGNFLFAMNDSIYHGMDKFVQREDHCYHYWNTHNPRLRFVHASHMRDTMIVTSIRPASKDTMRAGYITTTIEASKEKEWLAPQVDETGRLGSPNYGLFAFEVNPNPYDPDVPEYALWNPATKKYVAYVNGNLIIADQPSYYTLDIKSEGHSIVSNEMVRTSDVRVVAAQGKVIIQNAAGKKVFLQTALGKTLADTVLTSDQEEMAAPAGIVFVTVEGEETVKTIVK